MLTFLGEAKEINQLCSPRMQRWALLLSAYRYSIHYVAGEANKTADALSLLPLPAQLTPIDPPELINLMQHLDSTPLKSDDIKRMTNQDPELSTVKRWLLFGWPSSVAEHLKAYAARKNELSIHDGCIFLGARIVVPIKARSQLLNELHDAHPGITRMKALARGYCWWPNIEDHIERLVKCCTVCQEHQRQPQSGPIHPWRWPDKPWERVHADYFGPVNGVMCLLLIDAYSKWIEVYPVTNTTAECTTNKMRTAFATFGLPETLCTDNGPQFTSEVFKQFLRDNGVQHVTTAPYHPASNGLAERAVQTVKRNLAKQSAGTLQIKWDRFLFAYRTTPTECTGKSPAELMFGRTLRTRLSLLYPSAKQKVIASQQKMAQKRKQPEQLWTAADPVFTRLPHEPTWQPGTVVSSSGCLSDIQLTDGRIVRRHADHVRNRETIIDEKREESDAQPKTTSMSSGELTGHELPLAPELPRRSKRTPQPVDRFQAGI